MPSAPHKRSFSRKTLPEIGHLWPATSAIAVSILAALPQACCKESITTPAPVTITSVSPATGLPAGGTSVTITGTSFTNASSVTIGAAELSDLTVVSPTRMTGKTPVATSPGAKDVVVTTDHGSTTCVGCFRYVSSGAEAPAIFSSSDHTCQLASSGAAYCWGNDEDGQLANGLTACSSTPLAVSGALSFRVLAAGNGFTCGIVPSGAAYCWVTNYAGQLGTGSTT